MTAIHKKERLLGAVWNRDEGSSLGSNLDSVILGANSTGQNKGNLIVKYSFSNIDTCEKEITSHEDSVL